MAKIVYNACFGGFGLSKAALNRYAEIKGLSATKVPYDRDIERDDPALVQVVEEMGRAADGYFAKLEIADIPSGAAYRIDEYDGSESVETPDSYSWKIAK